MPDIIIPKKLNDRLSLDSIWQPVVTTLKEKVKKIIKESPYFFPDYTDHGIDHINEVLTLADRLIPEDTYACMVTDTEYLLDPRSVGFLVCAILIHDLGMFLKTDGIEQLVYGRHRANLVDDLDEADWENSWTKYMETFRRMKDNEKEHLFGRIIHISADPARQGSSITEDERRIIGEFLRQNHGRLAHEIAVHGFPGDQEIMLITGDGITDDDRDMIGLLARSHQMNIRDTEAYIERFGEGSKPYGIPAFYLMAVLRMADYLDASEKRAPEILERIQKIRVPASSKEWSWNQRITKGPKQWDLKKHNLEINATPQKSTEFVLLDNWLRSVQSELDLCWSILADQYSGELYRLTIHRILSNIQQKKSQEKLNEKFLTKEAKITANPAIVKLMMEPLYGDEPTYGVRELLQNAVDACVERKEWEEKNGHKYYKGLVDIRIENKTYMENGKPVIYRVFTITDNGMGMNEDVLLNYYLSAGASYRSSDAWMTANAPDGKSQVARTGKFGVGFLAAFLLGDQIEVHTQHCGDKKGYHFTFSQESAALDVERLKRTEPGTTITIRLKPTAIKNWNRGPNWHNWYVFDDPVVSYTIDGHPRQYQNLRLLRPPAGNDDWLEFSSDDFEVYRWKPNLTSKQPEFYCNGIRIYHEFPESMRHSKPKIHYPHISILDKQGKLAVDLARKKVTEIPMENTLLREVLRWHIARLLLTPWDSQEDHRQNLTLGFTLHSHERFGRLPFLLTPGGFNLNHASLISTLSVTDYVVLFYEGPDARNARTAVRNFLRKDKPCTIVAADVFNQRRSDDYDVSKIYYRSPADFTNDLLGNNTGLLGSMNIGYSVYSNTCSIWFRSDVPDSLKEKEQNLIALYKTSGADHLLTGCCEGRGSDMPIDPDLFPVKQFPAAFHVKLNLSDYDFRKNRDSIFVEMMKELLSPEPGWPQDLWIPYDMAQRKKKFRRAFDELKGYMDQIFAEQKLKAQRKAEKAERAARRKVEEAAEKARLRAEAMVQFPLIQAEFALRAANGDEAAAKFLEMMVELQTKAASGDENATDKLAMLIAFNEIFPS